MQQDSEQTMFQGAEALRSLLSDHLRNNIYLDAVRFVLADQIQKTGLFPPLFKVVTSTYCHSSSIWSDRGDVPVVLRIKINSTKLTQMTTVFL